MAEAIGVLRRVPADLAPARALRLAGVLRLAFGWTMLVGALLFFFGTSWDIQWHTYVGRDRTLIPPHLMMLAGVALSGIAALAAVLAETVGLPAEEAGGPPSTRFAGLFHGPIRRLSGRVRRSDCGGGLSARQLLARALRH